MARILGLDIGSHSVKAVLFEASMRAQQARTVVRVRRNPEGDKAETLKAAIRELLEKHPMQWDQVVVALPGPTLATHTVSLPFSDPRRIEQALPFEVESQLPFDLDEVVFDYQATASTQKDGAAKKADLLVGVVRKQDLRALLETLNEVGVDPRIVTHPALAYQNVLPVLGPGEAPEADPPAVAIVDLGHERTSVCIGRVGGGAELARTFSGGGRDLTRALSTEFAVPVPDAEAWKEAHGALASQIVGPDAERAAGAFVRGIQPVLRELRQTFKSYTARTRSQVSRVYLCGGTAKLPGLDEQLTRDLGVPVERLPLPNDLTAQLGPEFPSEMAQAYVLALRGGASGTKAPRFNVRQGEFAFKGQYDYARERIGRLAAFAATLLVLLVASGVVRNTLLSQREQAVHDRLCETTQKILGRCERNFDLAINMLQGAESPAAAVPRLSAVQLLAEMTQRIPADAKVTIEQVDVTLERITLRAETESTRQVDTVTAALKGYRCFREVQQRRVERTRDGAKVVFGLEIQVACPEDGPSTPQG
jgi:general secretion pathway protein L